MTDGVTFVLVLVAALGSGVMTGFFFAFSAGVMSGLGKLPPAQGIAAMQSINITVVNPIFLSVFVGTGLVSAASAVVAFLNWGDDGSVAALVGGVAYLVGSILLTGAANIPLNNALAVADPASAEGDALWSHFLVRWTGLNHVRTLASLVACAAFILALTAG